ncbi:Membrane associated serine protease, rhomboid family [Halopenitus malekzadehii]|uniref:Membrane associated serine protease, rhomboid family n=1 Tax=Halopenitus malekzadehii TaxID=1267564 RepID=A0A1H6I3I3_9EURY|nr:rhomboid family intramembrane serine protease [Halopenitus malekzadehii]SEH41237.1 Membrane associated serine protease, rhomboid family [Halopenitus malekzadehii]
MDRPGAREVARRIGAAAMDGARTVGGVELAAVFLAVPSVLVVAHLLPGSEAWAFSLANDGVLTSRWTLWTAFASSYVHADVNHLLHNVAVYWMIVGVAYPLSAVAGWRSRFVGVTIACLLVVPVVSAWATLTALGPITDAPSIGFSDVNTALLGYLLVVWFVAADRSTHGRIPREWVSVAAPTSVAVILATPSSVWYFPQYPAAAAVAAGVSALAFARIRLRRPAGSGRRDSVASPTSSAPIDPVREFLLVLGASVVVSGIVGSMLLVPPGSNVWAHLAGYLVGLAAALPLVGVER